MLVLSRKTEQAILLPEMGVEIQVLRIRGNSVSIGITAPSEVKILRGEIASAPILKIPQRAGPVPIS